MSAHNDHNMTFSATTPLKNMILKCHDKCKALKCDNFDVVVDKMMCFFSTSGGDESELKLDPDAAVFFSSKTR